MTQAGFIHVPAHPALAASHHACAPNMPSMSVDLMAAAVRIAVRTALASSDRCDWTEER